MRVIVADDHSLFRDGVVSLLEAAGFEVVGQVGDGRQAVDLVLKLKPDLILLDITMPHMGGLEALHQIRERAPAVQVVMLTVSDDEADLLEAMRSGAGGYLLKNLKAEEFLDLLGGLARGEAALTRQAASRVIHGLTQGAQSPGRGAQLTARELELLPLLVEGLPNRAIAQRLSVSENTVKYHVKAILQKLEAKNRTEAAMFAIRAGLVKPPR
ncbi:MAG: DNA-binding response regulator [Chloroflexi bacterium RBG_16_64_43]|nr:MAG: DNA-binding response regulator [Chloroflexi bacterium RBG_16_64_43]